MSFDRYSSTSILAKLTASNDERLYPSPPSTTNILHSMTLGLEKLYLDVSSSRKWNVLHPSVKSSPFGVHRSQMAGNVVRPVATYGVHVGYSGSQVTHHQNTTTGQHCYTDENGFLQTSDNCIFSALVGKRYKVVNAMGQGSFSQVFKVEDTFLQNKKLVLKLIRRGCEVLGKREKIFLEHLEGECRKGLNCFVKCLGWLQFADHMGLLLPVYSHTLLNYIYDPEESVNVVSEPVVEVHIPLLQPKARNGLNGVVQHPSSSNRPNLIASPIIPPATMGLQLKVEPTLRTLNGDDIGALRKVALSLLSAIFIIHKEGIIHGDIKPENIFVDNPYQEEEVPDNPSAAASGDVDIINSSSNHCENDSNQYGKQLRFLPKRGAVKLADFGNSIHVSEVRDYFNEFEIQSLPYRAPEVLIGLPFGFSIDIWSLGIMFIELCINKPLFTSKSRHEAVRAVEQRISKLDRVRFSGGKFSHVLFEGSNTIASISPSKQSAFNKAEHIKSVKRLISKSVAFGAPNYDIAEMMDFIGQMVVVDPNHRLGAKDLLQHSFLTSLLPIPNAMLLFAVPNGGSDSVASKKRKIQGTPFHSLNKHQETPRSIKTFSVNESKDQYGDCYRR